MTKDFNVKSSGPLQKYIHPKHNVTVTKVRASEHFISLPSTGFDRFVVFTENGDEDC